MIGEYLTECLIGKGVDAKCYLATKNDQTFCIKMIPIKKNQQKKRINTENEVEALERLQNHENIIKLVESFSIKDESEEVRYIITEAMPMNLEKYLRMKKGAISESTCKKIMFQVMSALNFCHLNLITHQDIKLENITIDPDTMKIKLIDFGYCTNSLNEQEICELHETQGTPLYLSPEKFMFSKYDGRKSDAWSCGVLMYKLVTGFFPFGEDCKTMNELYGSILHRDYDRLSSGFSSEFTDLIESLLLKDPKERISLSEALQHSFFSQKKPKSFKRSLINKFFGGSRNRSFNGTTSLN
eukprot:TRINITY_DN1812_c0_g1_i5.p1 TRINITY_DN1812_c0_g1~~TRINITY_DN1812_c0_g1_i5.p1  ORF type:complete len:299 (-),score=91.15 TRINITY_DN1812_c0_g1_i5:151-1047(-)